MAFPFLSSNGFETGSSPYDSETDTNSKLAVIGFKRMFSITGGEIPYRGAYCAHIDLSGGTADAFYQENNDWDTSASGTIWTRFYFYMTSDYTMATTNRFTIFALEQTSGAAEVVIDVKYTTAAGLQIVLDETQAGSSTVVATLPTDQWNCVEISATIDSGANDGTATLYFNGSTIGTISSLTQGAITHAQIGAVGIDAGTTSGHLFFDEIVADDAQIYPLINRFPPERIWVTHSQHALLGSGEALVSVTGSSTDALVELYDTYTANSGVAATPLLQIRSVDDTLEGPYRVSFNRGLYLVLSGTNVQAYVTPIRNATAGKAGIQNLAMRG